MKHEITFDPAAPVSSRYGAPMGRRNVGADFDASQRLHLQRLHLDAGGYDRGGAYWGHGAPIYAIFDHSGDFCHTLRAWSREAAKRQFREEYPDAWFHGERRPAVARA